MEDNQTLQKKKKLLEVPFDLIWDPNTDETGVIDGEQCKLCEIQLAADDLKSDKITGEKKKKEKRSKKSFFSIFRRRSSPNELLVLRNQDTASDAEKNRNNRQFPPTSSESTNDITEQSDDVFNDYPKDVECIECVDNLMDGLDLENSIEVDDEVMDEKGDYPEVVDISVCYIKEELESVREQEDALDKVAEILEPELRASMDSTGERKKVSDQLLKDWFSVVAKRHSLLERKYQLLRALENGDHFELELRTNDVKEQLHILMKIPEHQKTIEQRKRQDTLWRELIELVNKRDEIVQIEDYHRKFSAVIPCSEISPLDCESTTRKVHVDDRRRFSVI